MAFTFKKTLENVEIGNSLFDKDGAAKVAELVAKAKAKNVELVFPVDYVTGDKFSKDATVCLIFLQDSIRLLIACFISSTRSDMLPTLKEFPSDGWDSTLDLNLASSSKRPSLLPRLFSGTDLLESSNLMLSRTEVRPLSMLVSRQRRLELLSLLVRNSEKQILIGEWLLTEVAW